MISCFVPGCRSRYTKGGKSSISMFRPPADPDQLRQWELNIGRTDRALTRNDKVCLLHFEKRYVSDRYYSEHAGNVLLNEGKVPRLRKDAVPTIFDDRVFCGGGGVQLDSSAMIASQWWPVGATPCMSNGVVDVPNESRLSPATVSRMNTDADAKGGELSEHRVTVKKEDCFFDANHFGNAELCADERKIGDLTVFQNIQVKNEKDECCSSVQNLNEVVCGKDRPLIRPVCGVNFQGTGFECGVEEKKETKECVDEPPVPRIVCAVGSFYNTPTTPGAAQRVLVKQLLLHPEVVKLPFSWSYHKVSTTRYYRIVYSTITVAAGDTTPVITKFVNITQSRGHNAEPPMPFEAFVSDRSLNATLGDLAKPTTIEEVERMIEAVDGLPMCRGGPSRLRYPDADPTNARLDVLGVWRRVDCEVYGTPLCCHCAKLEDALRQNACRKRKGKDFSRLRLALQCLAPAQRYKVELLQRRSRCLRRKLQRLKASGRELCDKDNENSDDDSGSSNNEMECPEVLP